MRTLLPGWWSTLTSRLGLRKLERRELSWLLAGLASCVLLFAFFALAGGGEDQVQVKAAA